MMDKYHPGYFGKVGMRHYHLLRNRYHMPVLNVDRLWSLVGDETRKAAAAAGAGAKEVPVIDITKAGYFKLLGKGRLPKNMPFIVKAKYVSLDAQRKVQAAGGAVVLTA